MHHGGITKLQPKPDEHVLLYGAGPIGLMYIKVLRALGIRHLAVCAKGEKRKQEAARFGAEIVIDSVQGSIRETLMEKWRQQPDVVIDAVGAGAIFPEAVNLINSGGRILLFGFNKSARSEDRARRFLRERAAGGGIKKQKTFLQRFRCCQEED